MLLGTASIQHKWEMSTAWHISKIRVSENFVFVLCLASFYCRTCQITVRGPKGWSIYVKYAEIIEAVDKIYGGAVYTENLRSAVATDVYILSGASQVTTHTHTRKCFLCFCLYILKKPNVGVIYRNREKHLNLALHIMASATYKFKIFRMRCRCPVWFARFSPRR